MTAWWIYAIGFLAQGFFSARILVQWILSERAAKVVSPSAYWICSLAGSWLLFLYGWLRDDFAIILGQFLSYYIYIWNLNIKGIYGKIPIIIRIVLLLTPIAVLISIAGNAEKFISAFFQNEAVPTGLLLFGVAGQILFSLRFLYQWIYSLRNHESSLPAGFWIMSLSGSAIIVCYGIARLDPVLILGQSVGFAAYVRNLILCKRETAR